MKQMIAFFVTIAMITGMAACQKGAETQAVPTVLETDKDKASYAIGVNMAQALVKIKDEVNIDMVAAGLKDKVDGNTLLIEEADARALLAEFSEKLREKQMAERDALGQKNLEEGQSFLEANKAKPDVVTTENGLQYMVVKQGDGPVPTKEDRVRVHYRGATIDGTEFDSSYEREAPVTLAVTGVIKGWTEALQLMPVGSTYKLFVPPDLAYGPRGAGDRIGPNAVLVFDVELLEIVKPKENPAETPSPEM